MLKNLHELIINLNYQGRIYIYMSLILLCSWGDNYVSPFLWVVKLCPEILSEVCIRPIWRVVFFHEVYNVRLRLSFPKPPEPLAAHRWNGIDSPCYEHSNLGIIVPFGYRPRINALPCWFVFLTFSYCDNKDAQYTKEEGYFQCRHRHSSIVVCRRLALKRIASSRVFSTTKE